MALRSDQADEQATGPTAPPSPMTAATFWSLPDDGLRHELVRGEVRTMAPAVEQHGRVAMNLSFLIDRYIREQHLGVAYAAETGFLVTRDPDSVRAPDFAFVRADRAESARAERGFVPVAPDLVVEVVSPDDVAAEVQDKATMWLQAGVRLVWVVYPRQRQVVAYRALDDVRVLTTTDALEGGEVLPGFQCPVTDLFT